MTSEYAQGATPDSGLKELDRLVGTWEISGGATGQVTYHWLDGGYFLLQEVNLEAEGMPIKAIEIIGRDREFGATEASEDIRSRAYDNQGNTLGYVYEIEGDTLTIWGGEKGSPAYFRGTFSSDGDTVDGEWVYPDGGGYRSTMTKVG